MVEIIKCGQLPAGGEFDFYGQRYAVYGSKITIFSVVSNEPHEISSIQPNCKKVHCLSWCHPVHGPFLAAGCDKSIYIWKESALNTWEIIYNYSEHTGQITSLAWGPTHFGLNLLVSSEDQCFSHINNVYEDNWNASKRKGHNNPIASASWLNSFEKKNFVTAAENVKVWKCVNGEYEVEFTINEKYFDVKASTQGMVIAACKESGVFIWKKIENEWRNEQVKGAEGYMVQWSVHGNVLLACSKEKLYVIRQAPDMTWVVAQVINQDGRISVDNN